jgi:O-antigen/teichoic acid export membrane protein
MAVPPSPISPTESSAPVAEETMTHRMGAATSILAVRRILIMVISAVGTAVVARALGATEFGQFASALATFQLSLAFVDLGFSIVLTREMAQRPHERGALTRSATQIGLLWSAFIAVLLAGLALASGPSGVREQCLLVLSAGVALSGFGHARSIFMVIFDTRRIAFVDLTVTGTQLIAAAVLAALGAGAVTIAATYAVAQIANALISAALAYRRVDAGRPTWADRIRMLRDALPVGVASVLASLYFVIGLVVLGWLITGPELGHFAAAAKVFALAIAVPSLLAGGTLGGLASVAHQRDALEGAAARVAHWIGATGLPVTVGIAVFAEPLMRLLFGADYTAAASVLRIFMVTATLSLAANVLGPVLNALRIVRPQLVFNTIALGISITGLLIVVPHYGVEGAAWTGVAAEIVIVGYAVVYLRHRVSLLAVLLGAARPALSVAAAAAVALPLLGSPLLAAAAALAALVCVGLLVGAWPPELRVGRLPGRMRAVSDAGA